MYEANARAGTAQARTRSMVHGGDRSCGHEAHWPGAHGHHQVAAVAWWRWFHPPAPRDYSYAMPKKARRAALRNALFTKFRDGEVAIAAGWPEGKPSTRSPLASS